MCKQYVRERRMCVSVFKSVCVCKQCVKKERECVRIPLTILRSDQSSKIKSILFLNSILSYLSSD